MEVQISSPLDVHPQVLLDHMEAQILIFEKPPYCFPKWLCQSTLPATVYKGPQKETPHPDPNLFSLIFLKISYLFDNSYPNKWYLTVF